MAEVETFSMEGVEHLHGNLYRCRLDLIQFAEREEEGIFCFRNPRMIAPKPKGFSKEEMNELLEAIRTEGLEHPLLLRVVESDGKHILELVSGERRLRSIKKLVKDDAECFDPASGKMTPASELYDYVDVRINDMDDQTAWKHAFSGNDKAVGIGEGCTIALIKEFRNAGWTDDQILESTGKSVTWLKDTDTLIALDDQTLTALSADQINRSAALKLAQIEDVEERLATLDRARSFATDRLKNIKEKLEKEAQAAERKAELAEAEVVEAEFNGDDDAVAEAEARADKAARRAEKKRNKQEEADEPQITSKDLEKAQADDDDEDGPAKPLTKAKLEKFWYQVAVKVIKSEDTDEAEEDIDLEDARLVKSLCEAIDKGEKDIVKLLKAHKRAKDKRADA